MSCLIFGALNVLDAEQFLGPIQDTMEFFGQAETNLLTMQVRNRVDINFTIKAPPVFKMK